MLAKIQKGLTMRKSLKIARLVLIAAHLDNRTAFVPLAANITADRT